MFVRVKSAREFDPQHEFDVPAVELDAHPDLYKVVDKKPVLAARPPKYMRPVRVLKK